MLWPRRSMRRNRARRCCSHRHVPARTCSPTTPNAASGSLRRPGRFATRKERIVSDTTVTRRSARTPARTGPKTAQKKKRAPTRHLRVVLPGERPSRRAPRPHKAGAPDRAVALLLVATASLLLIGVAMVLSASSVSAFDRFGSSFLFFNRHLASAAAGVALAALTA